MNSNSAKTLVWMEMFVLKPFLNEKHFNVDVSKVCLHECLNVI